jgi:hypothetical protein
MLGKCVHDVELYAGVACETIEGKVRVALRVIVCSVVDHADRYLAAQKGSNEH